MNFKLKDSFLLNFMWLGLGNFHPDKFMTFLWSLYLRGTKHWFNFCIDMFWLQYHPDVSKDSQTGEVFKSIRRAYEVSNPYSSLCFLIHNKCFIYESKVEKLLLGSLKTFDLLPSWKYSWGVWKLLVCESSVEDMNNSFLFFDQKKRDGVLKKKLLLKVTKNHWRRLFFFLLDLSEQLLPHSNSAKIQTPYFYGVDHNENYLRVDWICGSKCAI